MGKTNLPFSRKKNSYVTFVESLVTLPRIVGIKRLKVEVVITCYHRVESHEEGLSEAEDE